MRAMVVKRYGPPEVFESREVPDPNHLPAGYLAWAACLGNVGRWADALAQCERAVEIAPTSSTAFETARDRT